MKVFLSYRRDDTGGRAGRLFDVLVSRFGARNVFQDVSAVAPGLDFPAQVDAAIEASDAVLVVVGPNWLGVDDDGGRRIDRPNDFVRQEVSKALAEEIPVVPVLVEGASLPLAEELPDDVASLVFRQAVTLRDTSWHTDVNDLIRRLQGDQPLTARRRLWPIVLAAGLVVIVVVAVVALLIRRSDDTASSGQNGDGSVATTSPISLPANLPFEPTPPPATRICGPGGQVQFSAGPIEFDGDVMTTRFTASADGLQTETGFDAVRVVDDQGQSYEVDGAGGFSLSQSGAGEREHSARLSMNRDEGAHPGTTGIVLIVTGECTHLTTYLPVSMPQG